VYILLKLNAGLPWQKTALNKKKAHYTTKLDLNFENKPMKCYSRRIVLYGAENRTFPKIYRKYRGSFEMWCLRRMENIIWMDRVREEEVFQEDKEERNIPKKTK
jgi:hypothetical protein